MDSLAASGRETFCSVVEHKHSALEGTAENHEPRRTQGHEGKKLQPEPFPSWTFVPFVVEWVFFAG